MRDNFLSGILDEGLLPFERKALVGINADGRLAVNGQAIPFDLLGAVFKAAYSVKVFNFGDSRPNRSFNGFRYDIWAGSDRFSFIEGLDGTEEFLKNGDWHCLTGPARLNVDEGWWEFFVEGELHCESGPAAMDLRSGEKEFFLKGREVDVVEFLKRNPGVGERSFRLLADGKTIVGQLDYADYRLIDCLDGSCVLLKKAWSHTNTEALNPSHLVKMLHGEQHGGYVVERIVKKGKLWTALEAFSRSLDGSWKEWKCAESWGRTEATLKRFVGFSGGDLHTLIFSVPGKPYKIAHLLADDALKQIDEMIKINLAGSPLKGMSEEKSDATVANTKQGVSKMSDKETPTRFSSIGGGLSTGIKKGAIRQISEKAAKAISEHLPMNDTLPMDKITQLVLLTAGAELVERAPDAAASKVGFTKERRQNAGELMRVQTGELMGRDLANLFARLAPSLLEGIQSIATEDLGELAGVAVEEKEEVEVPQERTR